MTRFDWTRRRLTIVGLITALALVAVVSPAVGGPNFLTLSKAKKAFFTKKQTNSQFLRKSAGYTRAQADSAFLNQAEGDAAFLTPAEGDGAFLTPAEGNAAFLDQAEGDAAYLDETEGDAQYLPRTGTMRLQIAPGEWVLGDSNTAVVYGAGKSQLGSTAIGTGKAFFAPIQYPDFIHGQQIGVDSFELCYDATNPGASIERVGMMVTTGTGATPFGMPSAAIDELATRNDATCRTYTPAFPFGLGPTAYAQVRVEVNYTAAFAVIEVGRLTINLID